MRAVARLFRRLGIVLGLLIVVLLAAFGLLQTQPGKSWLERTIVQSVTAAQRSSDKPRSRSHRVRARPASSGVLSTRRVRSVPPASRVAIPSNTERDMTPSSGAQDRSAPTRRDYAGPSVRRHLEARVASAILAGDYPQCILLMH